MTIALLLFLGFLILLYFWGKSIGDWKTSTLLMVGWIVKTLAACAFFYVYSEIYGRGKLAEDAGAYVSEAAILNDIYTDDPNAYYNVIFNKYDFEKTIARYFSDVKNSRIGPKARIVNDTRNQIKLISLLSFVVGNEESSLFAFFNLLSFLGLLVLWRALSQRTNLHPILIFSLLLLPVSLLFWTSSPLKECTSLFGIQLFIAALLQPKKTTRWIVIGGFGFVMTLMFKVHLIALVVAAYIVVVVYAKIAKEKKWSYALTTVICLVILSIYGVPKKMLFAISDKQFDFVNVARGGVSMEGDTCYYFLQKKHRDKIRIDESVVTLLEPTEMIAIEKGKIRRETTFTLYPGQEKLRFEYEQFGGNSYFEVTAIDRNWLNLLIALPAAIVNTCFRPFPWQPFFSIQNLILTFENLFFFYLLVQTLRKKRNIIRPHLSLLVNVLLIASLFLTLVIGWTTPISGAIVRYRIPIHLFILISFILTQVKHEHIK